MAFNWNDPQSWILDENGVWICPPDYNNPWRSLPVPESLPVPDDSDILIDSFPEDVPAPTTPPRKQPMKRISPYQKAIKGEIAKAFGGTGPNLVEDLSRLGKPIRIFIWIQGRKDRTAFLAAIDHAKELGLEVYPLLLKYRYVAGWGRRGSKLEIHATTQLPFDKIADCNAFSVWCPENKAE
jgi:hypothetical protein